MSFGERLKELREEKDLKQDEIAKIIAVDRSTYGKWENDSSKPDFEKLLKLTEFFNVSTDYLLGRTHLRKPEIEIHTIAAHADDDLTEEEREKLIEFAKFIKSQRK